MSFLAKNLKFLMYKKDMRQFQVARAAGVNKSSLNNYVAGIEPKGVRTLLEICKVLDCSIDDIMKKDMETESRGLQNGAKRPF